MKIRFWKSLTEQRGQTTVDYLLVVAVVVVALGSLLWSPSLRKAIAHFYKDATVRIIKPGK